MFTLLTAENIAFGYSPTVLVTSGILGFLFAFYDVREVTGRIEKSGEFRRAWKPFLLAVALLIALFSFALYGLAAGIVSITILRSTIAFAPTMFLGRFLFSWRWEARNHKEIQSVGSGRATLYAVPKGLTADEKYRIRWDIQQRRHQKNG